MNGLRRVFHRCCAGWPVVRYTGGLPPGDPCRGGLRRVCRHCCAGSMDGLPPGGLLSDGPCKDGLRCWVFRHCFVLPPDAPCRDGLRWAFRHCFVLPPDGPWMDGLPRCVLAWDGPCRDGLLRGFLPACLYSRRLRLFWTGFPWGVRLRFCRMHLKVFVCLSFCMGCFAH